MQKVLEDLLGRPLDNIEQSLAADAIWWSLGTVGVGLLLWFGVVRRCYRRYQDRPNEIWRQAVLLALLDTPHQDGIDLSRIWKSATQPLQFGSVPFASDEPNDIQKLHLGFRDVLQAGLVQWTSHKQEVFVLTAEGLLRARQLDAQRHRGLTKVANKLVARLRATGEAVERERQRR